MSDVDVFDNEERKERRRAIDERLTGRNKEDIRKLMGLVEGRRFVMRILRECGVYRDDIFDTNALTMAKLAGERRIGFFILSRLAVEEEMRMRAEFKSDKLIQETEINNAERGNTNG